MNSLVRLTKLILGAFAVLAFLAVLLTTVLLFLDLGWLRGQLESRATEAFGRQVTFAGAIHLKPSLWPTFMTEDFRIGNPAWASRPEFAQVERLEIQVALLPLLRGELQVLNITFRGADVFLEVESDGTNNFTFGHGEGPSTLPAIDKFSVLDSVIGYRENGEELYRCAVVKAEATNMPKQPVQLAGEIACRDVPMRFSLSGGISEKFASPTAPWPLAVAVSTKDTSLVAKGSLLPGPDRWHGSPFQVSIKAETPASLETLFDVELPVQRSFELSGKFTGYKGVYTLTNFTGHIGSTDIAGKLQWQQTGKRPFLKGRIVSRSLYMQDFLATAEPNSADNAKSALLDQPIPLSWMAAIDAELALDVENVMDGPVSIDNAALTAKLGNGELSVSPLRATLAGIPLTGNIAINLRENVPAFSFAAQTKRLDLQAILEPLGMKSPVQGNADNVTLAVNSQGHTLRTLLQLADVNLTTQEGHILLDTAEAEAPWTFEVMEAKIEAGASQPVSISVDGKHRGIPLSLIADTITLPALALRSGPWPLALTVSTTDASLDATGSVAKLGTWDGAEFQVSIQGNQADSLDALFELNLPMHGAFELSAELRKSKNIYSITNLEGRIGSTDIAGELQWKQADRRRHLKGNIISRSLHIQDFIDGSNSDSANKTDFLERPIPFDWIAAMDAEFELKINRVLGTSVPIQEAAATAKLSNGELSVSPLQATLAGIPLTGDLVITPREDAPAFSFAAQTKRLDLQAILEPLGMKSPVQGNADNVTLAVNSQGHTLRTLLQRADVSLTTQEGHILFDATEAEAPWSFEVTAAKLEASASQPVSIRVNGTYQDMPLTLVVDTVTLETLATAAPRPWPLDVSLHSSQVNLNATGSVNHPFQGKGFDLTFEIAGKDLSKVDSLIGFVIPLRNSFRVTGRFSDSAHRYQLNSIQANIGRSDIGGSIGMVTEQPRPRIVANLNSQVFHLEDLKLTEDVNQQIDTQKARLIPEFVIPVKALLSVNLEVDFKAERIFMPNSELGNLAVKSIIENGVSDLSLQVTDDWTGAWLNLKHQMDVTTNPPNNSLHLKAHDLDYGLMLTRAEAVSFAEGRVGVEIELTGRGATLRTLLSQADGRITVIGGRGRIASRGIELWISDLVRMMLSGRWLREPMVDLNCIVSRIDVVDGVAKTDKLLLDTRRLTIAGSGALDLNTERLDLLLSPNPKQASLVSLANPVRVTGTLTAPHVTVTKLPRRWTTATSGLLAGLVNPAFLLLAFSDIGSGNGNPCAVAIERRDSTPNVELQRRGILQRFRNLF